MIIQHIAPPSHAMASSAPSLRERAVAMPARIAAALGSFARRASSDSGSAQASAATGEVCRGALSRPRAAASGVPRVLSISLGGPGSDSDDSGAPAEALCRAANDRGSSNADAATAPATRALCRAPKSRLVSSLPSRIAISDQGACIDLNPNVSFPSAFAFVFADHHNNPITSDAPATPQDVDTAFIERALRAAGELPPGLRVARVDVRPLALQGFISDVARCRISYAAESDCHDDGGSQMASLRPSVIVKCTASGAESYAAGVECDAYRTEATFFAVLAEVVAVSSPDCLLVVADDDDARYCYVLEDLDERPGLYFVPQAEGAGEKECLAVAVGLAELHAPRWRWDAPLPAWVLPLTANRLRNPAAAVSEYWQAFSASTYQTELPPTSQRAFERVAARAATLAAALDQGPRTLLHGDARGDNLFFGDAASPGGVVFLDWQLVCSGIGAFDLAWFVSTSVRVPCEARDRRVVEAYWNALTSHASGRVPKERYSLEACWRDYLLGCATSMALFVLAPKFLPAGKRVEKPKEYAQLAEMVSRSAATVACVGADTVAFERLV